MFGITSERPVTLRATPVIQQSWLAPRLVALHREKPTILLRLVSAIWPDDFGPEGADIEIRYGRGEWSGLEMLPLGEEHLLPVCSPALARSLNEPADLAGHTLLHAVGFGVGWPGWLQAAGMTHLESECLSLTCDNQVMTLALASQGGGVALTHRRLLEQRDDLVAPFDMGVPSDERFWLVRPSKRHVSDEAADVWEWLAASR